jgi:two-component system, chemotaxis family, CheB/CheR fusion protein
MSLANLTEVSNDDGNGKPPTPIDVRRDRLGKDLSAIGDAVVVTDPRGKIVLLNHTAELLTGWADSDAQDQPIESVVRIIHEATRQPVIQPVRRVIEQGFAQRLAQPTLLIAKDGTERAIEDSAAPIRGDDSDLEGVLLIFKDISERRRLESSLAASELQFRRLFEAAKDGILILDGESGAITDANPYLLELLGYLHAEVVGKQLWEIGLLRDEEASRASFRDLQQHGYVRYEDLPLVTRRGRTADVEFVSNVYRVGDRMTIQCNIRDITERKQTEKELKRAKEEAEEAGRTKDMFLSALSHELRTPLTPVLATVGYIETMPDLPDRLRAEIASIRRNVELEARLIDDLLDVTRIGRGKLELHLEIVDVHVVVRSALELCQSELESKKLEVSLALRAEAHLVWADPARLQQVFWNLIKNAVKFTPGGGSIGIRSADTKAGALAIEVADTGAGIESEVLPRIFDVFEQGNREITRRHGGLGLGLAIAKMLVDLHAGTLTVTSQGMGSGAVFRVELQPFPESKHHEPPSDSNAKVEDASLKLLLVEDNADTLRAITLLLRSVGFVVQTATSVSEAMEALSNEHFNLLISDIGLPDGSGLDIMRHCRDTLGMSGIAFSGYATVDDVTESKAAGFAHHLSKPSSLNVLVDHIRLTAS